MPQIFWIASYPRSGNTWMRFLTASLFLAPVADSAALEALIPDIHRGLLGRHLQDEEGVTFVKTHWRHHARLPLREDSLGAVYLVRHPLDVLASNLDYDRLRRPEAFFEAPESEQRGIQTDLIESFIEEGGLPEWRQQGFGSWIENVESWLDEGLDLPRLVARYEDLRADPRPFLANFGRFLKNERSPQQIEAAIQASSLQSLRRMEDSELGGEGGGALARPGFRSGQSRGLRFVGEGRREGWRTLLDRRQTAAAASRFGPLLARLGYPALD